MTSRKWAFIWLLVGIAWFVGEWAYFHDQIPDAVYGGEAFYKIGWAVFLAAVAIPGAMMLLIGLTKLVRDLRCQTFH